MMELGSGGGLVKSLSSKEMKRREIYIKLLLYYNYILFY